MLYLLYIQFWFTFRIENTKQMISIKHITGIVIDEL